MKTKKTPTANIYRQLQNVTQIIQICSFIYAFLLSLYWFFNLAQLPVVKNISFLFDPVIAFVKSFYVQKNDMLYQVELAALVASILFIILGFIAKLFYDYLLKQQELYEIRLEKQKKEEDRHQQEIIQLEYYKEMKKYDSFVMLVNFDIQKTKGYLFESQVKDEEVQKLEMELMSDIFNSVQSEKVRQKSKSKDGMVYFIGDIKDTPACLRKITEAIKAFSTKYSTLDVAIKHDVSFDAVSPKCDIAEKVEFLNKIIKLQYDNTILTTSLFKTSYELLSRLPMYFTALGQFQIKTTSNSVNCELYKVTLN